MIKSERNFFLLTNSNLIIKIMDKKDLFQLFKKSFLLNILIILNLQLILKNTITFCFLNRTI